MKILAFSSLYPPFYKGGYEIAAKSFIDNLRKRGHQVTVVSSKYGVTQDNENDPDILRNLHYLNFNHLNESFYIKFPWICSILSSIRRFILTIFNVIIAGKIIRRYDPDILFLWDMREISYHTVFSKVKKKIPIVIMVEDEVFNWHTINNRFFSTFSLSKDYIRFNHIFCVSKVMKDYAILAGYDINRISVVPNGISNDWLLKKITIKKPSGRLLYVGRLSKIKGIHNIIKAFNFLHKNYESDIFLTITGSGDQEYVTYLKALITKFNLMKIVRFQEKLSYQKLKDVYTQHDLLIVSSIYREPFGLILIEAMSRGIPVIASNIGGPSEIIKDQITGLLYAPNDPKDLARKIQHLLTDHALYNRIRSNAIAEVKNHYLIENVSNQIEQTLIGLLKDGRK
ncbi:glycosyltransferase family 4 protein [uncultured Desulfosarcina sp.]|uniref:glycosyltransferase family 4 protein n=1 Tax=uncultured Desulfosarcina sp. TaxID=218289 RepID=UPI0029C6FD01|nr:glycosyltransferase family 4 protein [uncultured Desulfosarcina sp.]